MDNTSCSKYRATDIAEREILCCVYEIKRQEPMCEDLVASHRDSSILNGTLVIETPNKEMEQESWKIEKNMNKRNNVSWTDVANHKV